jgi:hypothetical protein
MCSDVCFLNKRNRHFYHPESEADFSLDYRITFVFSEEPILSVCQTSKKVMVSKSIMHCHLTQTMRWNLRHLQGVPHSPTESEKKNLVQRATKLLELLEPVRYEVGQYIVTFDDSWFY